MDSSNAENLKNLYMDKGEQMSVFTAVVQKEDTLYVAQCPEVGTASQGETIEEAIKNLQEATELYLEEFPMKQVSRPLMTTFEVPAHA
jgi:predicted RNase H-like HicB family nuclease